MNEVQIFKTAEFFAAVPQNGIISAGGGHFNALCRAVTLATGKRFGLVYQTLQVWYDREVIPTLYPTEGDWSLWDYEWHDFLKEGLPPRG